MAEDYRVFLKQELENRKKRNPRYSLRAFARFVNIDVSILSKVLAKKTHLSAKQAVHVAEVLNLEPARKRNFLLSVSKHYAPNELDEALTSISQRQIKKVEEKLFESLSKLINIAVYELVRTKEFKNDADWIAKRLSISKARAEEALQVLIAANLIGVENKVLSQHSGALNATRSDITTPAMRVLQREIREASLRSIDSDPFETRVMSGMTMAVNPSLLPQVRAMIHKMMEEISSTLETPELTEVYQLEVSLFPLTQLNPIDSLK